MNRNKLGDIGLPDVRPDGFDHRAVGKRLFYFDGRVWLVIRTLNDQPSGINALDNLPFEKASLFEPLGCVYADEVSPGSDAVPNRFKEHRHCFKILAIVT
jgi:hypothetical protein